MSPVNMALFKKFLQWLGFSLYFFLLFRVIPFTAHFMETHAGLLLPVSKAAAVTNIIRGGSCIVVLSKLKGD